MRSRIVFLTAGGREVRRVPVSEVPSGHALNQPVAKIKSTPGLQGIPHDLPHQRVAFQRRIVLDRGQAERQVKWWNGKFRSRFSNRPRAVNHSRTWVIRLRYLM